eukprot:239969_1
MAGTVIDCGVTGDCTLQINTNGVVFKWGGGVLDGSNLNGSNLYFLTPPSISVYPMTVKCPLIGDCNVRGYMPDLYSDSSVTTNILTINVSSRLGTVRCPAYSSTRNCFINFIPGGALSQYWLSSGTIYADGGFGAQLSMHLDPSLHDTYSTYATHHPFHSYNAPIKLL